MIAYLIISDVIKQNVMINCFAEKVPSYSRMIYRQSDIFMIEFPQYETFSYWLLIDQFSVNSW